MPIYQGLGGRGVGSGGAGPIKVGYLSNPDLAEQGAWQLHGQREAGDLARQRDAAQFGHQVALQQARDAAENQRMAQQMGLEQQRLAQQGALSRAQIEASLAPLRFQQQKFSTIFPWVQGQLGGLMGGGGGNFGYQGPGLPGTRPEISDAPVYTDQQIEGQVNATRAQNDMAMASQQRQAANQMAGRGFGANSPLAMALQNSLAMANTATNTGAEQDLRFKAASANASQRLDAQKARSAQDLGYLGEQTKRGIAGQQQQTALISALLGMI